MNANAVIKDSMSLEDKLKAIDEMMKEGAAEFNKRTGRPVNAPVDPGDLLQCEGCQ